MSLTAGDAAPSDPHPAFEPIVVNRAPRAAGRTARVVVFNARFGSRLNGILACFRRPPLDRAEVILLCEADWRLARSGGREIAAELAGALGLSFAYVPEFAMGAARPREAFIGNAILCAQPLEDVRGIVLPRFSSSWRRVSLVGAPRAITASARFGGRRIAIGLAHLNSRCAPALRARQMAVFMNAFDPRGPAIIGGDWNTTTVELATPAALAMVAARMALRPRRFRYPQPYEPLFDEIARRGFAIDGANRAGAPTFTFARAIPPPLRPKLDWIAARDLSAISGSARVIPARPGWRAVRVSDHDFVICDFAV